MSDNFLGEIKITSIPYAPKNWAFCNGQMLPIAQNQALFSLIGNSFGGNSQNFALPNFQGRVPIHVGNGHLQGEQGGEPTHSLTTQEIPAHNHAVVGANDAATKQGATNNLPAQTDAGNPIYGSPTNQSTMGSNEVATTGSGQGHQNMQPYLAVNFSIALVGTYPSRN